MIVSMALASALTVGAAPAHAADAEILSPADGEIVKSSGPVAISAKTDWYQISMSLYVEGPSVPRQKIASGGANQTISGTFDPGDAPNGTFTITLAGEVTHKTYATSTFVLSRPPAAPTGVDARLKNPSTIVVTWAKGAEPDLESYEITSAKAGKTGSVSADSACSGSTCQTSLALPEGLGGQNVDVSVRAFRSDGVGGTIASQRSSAVYVAVPAPKASPSPSPTPSKAPDQSAAETPAAKTPKTHHSTEAQNPEPATPEDTGPAGHTGLNDTELTLPEDDGGSDQTKPVDVPGTGDSEKTDTPETTAQSSFTPLGGLSFGVYIALAVVLLLTGASLGAWLRGKRPTGDTAGDGRPGGSGAQPVTEQTGSSPQTAMAASGAAALAGAGTAKARETAPVRRPSVVLARPKARESSPETEAETATETASDLTNASSTTTGEGTETRLSEQEPVAPVSGPDRQETPTAASLPPVTRRVGGTGQVAPAHVSLPSATRSDQMPVLPVPAVPASGVINAELPERPLRQPEPDIWREDDDTL